MSDFNVKVSVRNGRLLRAIRNAGYKTQSEFSAVTGVPQSVLNGLVCFRYFPVTSEGEWKEVAWDISSAVRIEPEELWPEELRKIRSNKNSFEVSLSADEVRSISSSSGGVSIDKKMLTALLCKLPRREREVIEMRFGLKDEESLSLDQVGERILVSRERVRQIEAKGIRHLRGEIVKAGFMPRNAWMLNECDIIEDDSRGTERL